MTRKRFIKRMMGIGVSRNAAQMMAALVVIMANGGAWRYKNGN